MKIRKLILGSMILVGSLNAAETAINKMNAATVSKLESAKKYSLMTNSINDIKKVQYPYFVKDNQLFVNLLVQVSSSEAEIQMKELGCQIMSHTSTIYSIKAPANAIDKLSGLSSINAIEASRSYKVDLDSSKKAMNAENVTAANVTPTNIIGGEGVLVGILDTGIDFVHPDFLNADGTTRVLKLWDMSDSSNIGPEGYENFKWGKEYTKYNIDNEPANVKQVDRVGHGTHVTGIAAGGGKVDPKFRGIAYGSDILYVKAVRDDSAPVAYDADIIVGCEYLVKEAKKLGKPIVINLSLANSLGSHDGKSLLSLAISELSGPGAVFSVAAGNDGYMPFHAGGKVQADTLLEFPIFPNNVCWAAGSEIDMCDNPDVYCTLADFWYSKDLIDSVFVLAYDIESQNNENPLLISRKSFPIGINAKNETVFSDAGAPIALIDYTGAVTYYNANNAGNLKIEIHNNADTSIHIEKYLWSIVIKTKNTGRIDLWGTFPISEARKFKSIWETEILRADNKMTVGSPGDADSVICVGAFTTKNSWTDIQNNLHNNDWVIGDIADFSSCGPTRDDRILPLIAAPGSIIFSAKSKDSDPDSTRLLPGGNYVGMNGTSMATPHITGAIALMLQINPMLGYTEIADVISKTAIKDNFTTTTRNNTFGCGKINVQGAIDYLMAKSGVDYVYANDVKVYPNPAINNVNFGLNSSFDTDNITLSVYNSIGEKVSENLKYSVNGTNLSLDISSFSSGIYNVECMNSKSIAKFRFVVK